jgi:Ca2+-binding RTX toxin-like protein
MPSTITSANSIFDNTSFTPLIEASSGTTSVLGGGYVISGTGGDIAMFVGDIFNPTSHVVNIDGAVMAFGAFGDGIRVWTAATADINIGRTGTVYGRFSAIDAQGQTDIVNAGSISSNSGDPTIRSGQSDGSSTWGNTIINVATDRIANDQGVAIAYDSTGIHILNNSGVISAGTGFFTVWGVNTSIEQITNSGLLTSGVTLGAGNDSVDTRLGRIDGTSELGSGNDRYFGSNFVDSVLGGDGADTLRGYGGNDLLNGGNENDVLIGGIGADTLTSGNGTDNLFQYTSIAESTVAAAGRDTITDFSTVADRIDLHFIDANATLAGNNAFTSFVGAGAFTGLGQIRAVQSGADTIVQFNTTGSTAADMSILLQNVFANTLTFGDFIA